MRSRLLVLCLCFSGLLSAQVGDSLLSAEPKVDIYRVSSGEMIFSLADIDLAGESIDPILRFSAFFHFQEIWNFDFSDQFGFQAGVALRNVGFITRDDPIRIAEHQDLIDADDEVDIKRRAYSFGIPIAFKLGKVKKGGFFFAGAEPELMFHYKEKLFVNGDKDDKYNEWFSDKVNIFNPSVFAGFQFKSGINLKLKYYLDDFLNPGYEEMINGVPNLPYQNLGTRMFYISISAGLSPDSGFGNIELPEDRT